MDVAWILNSVNSVTIQWYLFSIFIIFNSDLSKLPMCISQNSFWTVSVDFDYFTFLVVTENAPKLCYDYWIINN